MSQVAHINRFQAKEYRGISGLEIEKLSGINLFVGKNGVGKTSLLEALWLFHGRFNPGIFWSTHIQRTGHPPENPLAEICEQEVELRGQENESEHGLKAVFEPNPSANFSEHNGNSPQPFFGTLRIWVDDHEMKNRRINPVPRPSGGGTVEMPTLTPPNGRPSGVIEGTVFSSMATESIARFFSQGVLGGNKKTLKKNLNTILPTPAIKDIDIVVDQSGTLRIIATTLEDRQFRIESLGSGMVRLFRLFASLFYSRNGIVLIDEIETGLHHSVLPEFWRLLREASQQFNVQVFATTHSWDCLHSAIAAFREYDDLFSVHTLYLNSKENRIDADALRGENLRYAQEMNLEIR